MLTDQLTHQNLLSTMFSFFDFIQFLFGGRPDPKYKVGIAYTYSPMLGKVVSETIKCNHKVKILMPNETIPDNIKLLIVATDFSVNSEEIVHVNILPDNTPVDTMLSISKNLIKEAYDKSIPILALGNGGLFLRHIVGGYITYQHSLPIAHEVTVDIPWADKSAKANMIPPSVVLKTEKAKPFVFDTKGNVYGYIKDSDGAIPPIIICQMPLDGLEPFIQTSILNLAEYEKPAEEKPEPSWVTKWKNGPVSPPTIAPISPPEENKTEEDNGKKEEDEEGDEPVFVWWGIRYTKSTCVHYS